jgi:hypothetical protein
MKSYHVKKTTGELVPCKTYPCPLHRNDITARSLKEAKSIQAVMGDDLTPDQAASLMTIMKTQNVSLHDINEQHQGRSIRSEWRSLCTSSAASTDMLTTMEHLTALIDDPASPPVTSASFEIRQPDGTTRTYRPGDHVPDGALVIAHVLRSTDDGDGTLLFRSDVADPAESTHMAFSFIEDLDDTEPLDLELTDPKAIVNPISVDETILLGRKAQAKIGLLQTNRMRLDELVDHSPTR